MSITLSPTLSSPIIRMKRKRRAPLTDSSEIQSSISSLSVGYPRTSTPTEKMEYVEPIVIIRQPEVLSKYFSSNSPRSIQERILTDFDKEVSPLKTPKRNYTNDTSSPSSGSVRRRKNVTIGTTPLVKKIKLWLDQQESPKSVKNLNLFSSVLSKKSTCDLSSDDEARSINSMSSLILSPMRSDDRELSDNSAYNSSPVFTRDYFDVVRGISPLKRSTSSEHIFPEIKITRNTSCVERKTGSSIQTEGIVNRSEDESVHPMSSMAIPSRASSYRETFESEDIIGYISSTTSLWDVGANPELSYSIMTPSDITDDADYSVVFNRRYQKEIERKQQVKYEEEQKKIQQRQLRRDTFKEFHIDNISWSVFSSEKIRFSVKPKNFFPNQFSSKKKYSFSMIFNGKQWNIKIFRIPESEAILKLYNKVNITDRNIKQFLEYVVAVIFRNIELEKEFKEERAKEYYSGKDIDLNDSDIELLLNENEKKKYKERCEKLWKGMMSPDSIF